MLQNITYNESNFCRIMSKEKKVSSLVANNNTNALPFVIQAVEELVRPIESILISYSLGNNNN